MSYLSGALAGVRRSLISEFVELPHHGDVVAWQRRLADEIIEAETGWPGIDRSELKEHRHLLRVIGDALVHALLPSHTIRALSRHPGKPASLYGQGDALDFVFECALECAASGRVPIIADLTTLIGIGDLVCWGPDGVSVLECKNRVLPARLNTSGRLARQRQRGERTEEYLTSSRIDENDGTVRQAYDFNLPSPDWPAVLNLLERCAASPTTVVTHEFGENDTLIACTSASEPQDVLTFASRGGTPVLPAFANYSELIDHSNHRLMAPSSYPLPGELRWRLLERDLHLFRSVDLGGLAHEFVVHGSKCVLTPEYAEQSARVTLNVSDLDPIIFNQTLVSFCLWMPVSIEAMRTTLTCHARSLVADADPSKGLGSDMKLADGDSFRYATAYRPGSLPPVGRADR